MILEYKGISYAIDYFSNLIKIISNFELDIDFKINVVK